MSCLVTSATRMSRTDPLAVEMASAAASSQEEALVPITSITRYTLMTTSPSLRIEPSIMVAPYGSVDGCPLLPVIGRKQTPGVHDHAVEDRPDEPSLGGRGWCRCRRSTPAVGQDAHRHQLVDLVHHADLGSPLPWSGGSGQYLRES